MAGVKGRSGPKQEKPWRDALMLAVNEAAADQDQKKLRKIAEKCVEAALEGRMDAIKEIGDRLDGKPAQALTGDDGGPIALAGLTVTFVRPDQSGN
jgi:hypothetical protein